MFFIKIIQILQILKNDMMLHFYKVSVNILDEVLRVHSAMSLPTKSRTPSDTIAIVVLQFYASTQIKIGVCPYSLSPTPFNSHSIYISEKKENINRNWAII